MSKYILVTGAAGFIGYHLCNKLLSEGYSVVGIDNLNTYYDVNLKKERLRQINNNEQNANKWTFIKSDISNKNLISEIFEKYLPKAVFNLAAQAGVRYSIENPEIYINSNIVGFSNVLESCRKFKVENFIYASSSSVYGGNTNFPYSESDSANHPISLYAATKRSNELIAHAYSHLYNIPSTGLRFFTVYGPWGRPDMAPMKFTKQIFEHETIQVYNYGNMSRGFTYIEDVTNLLSKLINKKAKGIETFDKAKPNPSISWAPHKILNIGNSENINLLEFINILEKEIGIKAKKEFLSLQAGDVLNTSADCTLLKDYIGNSPKTPLKYGIKEMVKWYKEFYKL